MRDAPDSKEIKTRLLKASANTDSQNQTLESVMIQDDANTKRVLGSDAQKLGSSIPHEEGDDQKGA